MADDARRDGLRHRDLLRGRRRRHARAGSRPAATAARRAARCAGFRAPSPRCCSRSPCACSSGRFDRLVDDETIFTGVTYTDAHITLTGLTIVAVALAARRRHRARQRRHRPPRPMAGRRRSSRRPSCYVLVSLVGWYVNSFIVKPNELVRERPYITHNIEMTRQAYGLDRITLRPFPAESGRRRHRRRGQPRDAREPPALGLARAAGHAAADSGNPHVLRFPRHRHRPLRPRRHGPPGHARHPRAQHRQAAARAAATGSTKS